jgi:aryl-alcohol dehydrogenase-like predicted oxidoreductase
MKRPLCGRNVFPIGLGAMNLSLPDAPSRAQAIGVIEEAIDLGIELVDTADVYAPSADQVGHNERLIAAAKIGDAIVASKGGVVRDGDRWRHDGRPAHLRAACEASLARLGRIDLYYLHAIDERVPIEESIGELARLKDAGKIGAIGVSNADAISIERAMKVARIEAVQNEASPYVTPDPGVLSICETNAIAFVAHSPMGGWRAGRTAHLPVLRAIADELSASPFEVVLAWLLSVSEAALPIPGASRIENVRSSVRAASLRLSVDQRLRISGALA